MRHTLRIIGILFLLSLTGIVARAQAPAWQAASAIANTTYSSVLDAKADASGNVFVVGQYVGSMQLGSTMLIGSPTSFNMYVAKWNRTTNTYVWALGASNGTTIYAPQLALAGNSVYIVGGFVSSTLALGGLTLTNSSSNTSQSDGFVAKITDAGSTASFTWAQQVSGPDNDGLRTVVVAGSSVYVGGYFGSPGGSLGGVALASAGGSDGLVAKLTDAGSTGSVAWAVRAGGADQDEVTGLAVGNNGLYLVGQFGATVNFGGTIITTLGGRDGFVAKLTDAGSTAAFSWAQGLGGTNTDYVTGVAVAGSSVYATGYFFSATCTLGATVLANAGGTSTTGDGFVAKLTDAGSTGSFAWAQRLGGTQDDNGAAVAASGTKVYVVGSFGSSYNNSPPAGQATFGTTTVTSAGGRDAFVTRLTDAGSTATFDWVQQVRGTRDELGNALALSGTTVYVAGSFNSATALFGTISVTNSARSDNNGFLASLTDLALSTTSVTTLPGLALYPNPAHGTATVRVPAGPGPATLTLLDALGRVVCMATTPAGADYALSLVGLAPGVYALRVQVGEAQAVRQVVVE